jgi:glycosyltransferase involved in cell wall biosynthesis
VINRTFAAVIPVVPKHITFLQALLDELENATKLFQEIWIIASSIDETSEASLRELQKQLDLSKLHLEITNLPRTAGQNRNIGFEKANSDYICFLDADDSYSPLRLEIIDNVITLTGAQVIYHDYFRLAPRFLFNFTRSDNLENLVRSEELFQTTFGSKERLKFEENGFQGNTNIVLPSHLKKFHRVQHGHVTVSAKLDERFSDMKIGEDGRFARDCLYSHLNVIYIPKRLSIYDRLTITNVATSTILRTLRILALLKNRFIYKRVSNRGEQ